jgi:hypothetical protein
MPQICDRCGFRVERPLRREWTNLLVCGPCFDPKPADRTPPRIGPEGLPRKNPRPYPPDVIVGPGDITPDDL